MKRNTLFWMLAMSCFAAPSSASWENVLGEPSSDWRIASDGATTTLIRLKALESDSELTLRVRLAVTDKPVSFHFVPGLESADDDNGASPLRLNLAVASPADPDTVTCYMPPLPGRGPYDTLNEKYQVRSLPINRLTWPAMVRGRVEQDFASAPPLRDRWLTVRFVCRASQARIFLDGRLLRQASSAEARAVGLIRLSLGGGAELSSVRVTKLPPQDPLFEPIQIDHDLNANQIGGQTVQRDSLPAAVDGVPIVLPAPDERGNDHIDLGKSWMRFGLLEGGFDGGSYDTSPARWQAAMTREAGRICFRVPKANYSRLHLLAAFDGEADEVPIVTAQFYRRRAGLPVTFSARVPLFTSNSSDARPVQVKLADGHTANLYLITILLDPNELAAFLNQDHLELELTKATRVYRAFPDPAYYSEHGAGLPSGVHVYAITLQRPLVEADLQPDQLAHIWTAPAKPSYSVHLRNRTGKNQSVQLELLTWSHDGSETTSQRQTIALSAGETQSITLPITLARYGYHRVELRVIDEQGRRTHTRGLAYLHPDTRERGNWEDGKGPLFGFWHMKSREGAGGDQGMPPNLDQLRVAVAAGVESSHWPLVDKTLRVHGYAEEDLAFARQHGMVTHFLEHRSSVAEALGTEFDPSKPDEMSAKFAALLKDSPIALATATNMPQYVMFFGEPHIGPVTFMSLPEYYDDPPYQLTPHEQESYQKFLNDFLIGARAVRSAFPGVKCLMPYGVPTFTIPFLRHSKEATELLDGPAIDLALFERLPEMQMGQVTYGTMLWQFKQEWIKAGKPWPAALTLIEGGPWPAPATAGALTMQEEADRTVRSLLLLCAYGITRQYSGPKMFRVGESYGEQHYGGGLCEQMPLLSPKPAYAAYATLTRQLNRMNYVKSIDTGSASVFCLQFKHYKTGELLHVMWTLRGTRPVTLRDAAGALAHDSMDNPAAMNPLIVSTSPCYIRGLNGDAEIALGEPDHSDAQPATHRARLANLGDGTWKISSQRDEYYETAHADFVRKFPGVMSIASATAPQHVGGSGLAVHLEPQDRARRTMPFYTTLVPPSPITIPGKSSHLGLWVRAASDWGRVVYVLRDAADEQWISIGKKGEWNVDDIHCWSAFNFDGWRYLRFDLPGNQPWDCFRDAGTSFWGYENDGDGIVDLPLTLDKIIVERRTHVIKVDKLEPAAAQDVLLGDLYAGYENEMDQHSDAVRLSRLRMPQPSEPPAIDNPIDNLAEAGVGAATRITHIAPPEHAYDGTRCHVFFDPIPGAKHYDVWVSTYADGRGAVRLGQRWSQPGQLLTGLPANVEIFLFVTYMADDERPSKPSSPHRVLLKDAFPFK